MGLAFALRFDLRNPAFAGTALADRYDAALEMAEWADGLGCATVVLSEHHASPDGYLPSPITMAAAMAARTQDVRFTIAALIAPFYEPVRLAEDLLVLDHLSRGRVDLVLAAGYVRQEFELFGIPSRERGARLTEAVAVLRAAFAGDPFEHQGRTIQLTPGPYREGGLAITLGGSSAAAAPGGDRLALPDGHRRRGAAGLRPLRRAHARRVRRGAASPAVRVHDPAPAVRRDADRAGLGEPPPLRAGGAPRVQRLTGTAVTGTFS
jgi:alkanesulfonate monooxygenase SsuD/methylene tetrahydromethanopterin reductase-like flavin-dependent oxidoreductase (luciferase family)